MRLILLFIFQVAVLAGVVSAKEFAVANIASDGVPAGQANLVSNALRSHLMRESKGDMVPASIVTNKQGTDVTNDVSELVSLGKTLDANLIIGGTVIAVGDNFKISLDIYEVATSSKVGELFLDTEDGFGGVMQTVLPEAAKKIAAKDYAIKEVAITPVAVAAVVAQVADTTPAVEEFSELTSDDEVVAGEVTNAIIGTQPEGAEISLDGTYIGISNLLYETTTGPHELSVVLEGYRDTTFFVVFTGENNILDIPLYADKIAKEFEKDSEGVTTKSIVRIASAVVAVGSLAGALFLNSQVSSLNEDLENATNEDEATQIGDDIRSKQQTRNILYGVAGAGAVGFGVTFFIE